jgi:hypothetical protein
MSRTPRLTGAALVTALEAAGFTVIRIKGSHHFRGTMIAEALLYRCMPAKPSDRTIAQNPARLPLKRAGFAKAAVNLPPRMQIIVNRVERQL